MLENVHSTTLASTRTTKVSKYYNKSIQTNETANTEEEEYEMESSHSTCFGTPSKEIY